MSLLLTAMIDESDLLEYLHNMERKYYNTKVDWWVTCVVIFSVTICFIGPMIDGETYLIAFLLAFAVLIFKIAILASVKYQIRGSKLGIRNLFYRWDWFPIEKITEVKATKSVLSSSALSFNRLAIRFSDKKILKSSMPLEISPKDRDDFIARLKEINPSIVVKV